MVVVSKGNFGVPKNDCCSDDDDGGGGPPGPRRPRGTCGPFSPVDRDDRDFGRNRWPPSADDGDVCAPESVGLANGSSEGVLNSVAAVGNPGTMDGADG